MENIRISLAAARVNADMTQAEIAKELHVSPQTILNWEKGKSSPTMAQARKLSEVYGLPQDYIFFPDNQI